MEGVLGDWHSYSDYSMDGLPSITASFTYVSPGFINTGITVVGKGQVMHA